MSNLFEIGNGTIISEGVSLALDINNRYQYVYKNKKNSINDCSTDIDTIFTLLIDNINRWSDFMSQEQNGIKRIQGIGVVAAFGLLTMSSSIASNSLTTMNVSPAYYCEAHNYIKNDNILCNSSMLSRQAVGDIASVEKKADFVQQHEKINVNIQITKITMHISSFEFEEEYEEI